MRWGSAGGTDARLGIPGEVADSGAVAALGGTTRWAAVARVMGGAGGIRGTCAEGRREGNGDQDSGETIELSGKFLKTRMI
jgi:hypothetical protein